MRIAELKMVVDRMENGYQEQDDGVPAATRVIEDRTRVLEELCRKFPHLIRCLECGDAMAHAFPATQTQRDFLAARQALDDA